MKSLEISDEASLMKDKPIVLEGAYPTRIQDVGKLSCLFLSFYQGGRFPIISIGPSWPFTILLLLFVSGALAYFFYLLTMTNEV